MICRRIRHGQAKSHSGQVGVQREHLGGCGGCEPGGAHSVSPSLLLRPHAPAFPRLLAFSEEGAVSCGLLVDGVLVEE